MFIEQAYKGNNQWWRVLLTSVLTAGVFVYNIIFYLGSSAQEMKDMYKSFEGLPNNLVLFLNLVPFAFLLILLFVLVKLLHHQSLLSLTTARKKIDFNRVFFSFFLIVTVSLIGFAVSYFTEPSVIKLNFDPAKFAVLLMISLLLFPFQIGLEEYLFRGFFMQQIGIIAKNRWVPLIITSIMFGVLHSANPEVAELGFGIMAYYIGTGLLLGIMTLMDDGMELALGFHLGNNIMSAVLITYSFSALQTDAIFKYTGVQNSSNLLTETIISIAIFYPILLFILSKKYKWNNWLQKLSGRVVAPTSVVNE